MCIEGCPHGVFGVRNGKAVIVDRDACIECGACALNCPIEAIKVRQGVGCAQAVLQSKDGANPTCGYCNDGERPACC